MKPSRGWLGLAGAAGLLYGLNLLLAQPAGEPDETYAAPLVEPRLASSLSVAAVSIRPLHESAEAEFLYVRTSGMWRCATTFGAVADGPLLESLLSDFTGAIAVQRQAAPSQDDVDDGADDAFGFGPAALRVTFHGSQVMEAEDRDALLAFDLGRSLPSFGEGGRSFVRRAGERAVYEIDSDPRGRIAWDPTSRIPPLLDRKIIGGPWPGREFGFSQVTIERAGSAPLILFHEKLPPQQDGSTPWRWTIEGAPAVIPRERVLGFTSFCLRAQWQGFANPAEARELGLLPPAAKITLTPFAETGAEDVELLVSPPTPQGSSLVFHRQNKMLFIVDAETARLYAPTQSMWTDGERNPWELWLAR